MRRKRLRKATTTVDVRNLLRDVQAASTDSARPVSDLLRMCLVLAHAIGSQDLVSWARSEINGYGDDDVPDYRILHTQARGDFRGPLGSGITDAQVPIWLFEREEWDDVWTMPMGVPIAEVAELARSGTADGQSIGIQYPAHKIAKMQEKESPYPGMVVASAYRPISPAALTGILDIVRTRALEFSLEIGNELPAADEQGVQELPPQETVSQIFHTTITAPSNVAVGNAGPVEQTLATGVHAGDLESLIKCLRAIDVEEADLIDLQRSIQADGKLPEGVEGPGPEVTSWMGRVIAKMSKAVSGVGSSATGSIVAKAVMDFFGLTG